MGYVNYIGWDIGGAHLKVAAVNQTGNIKFVRQYASPLWQGLEHLEKLIPEAIGQLPKNTLSHAVTVTAELIDLFSNREQGMNSIIEICENKLGSNISLYGMQDGLLDLERARKNTDQIASANWHASASYAASLIDAGVFIDIGSTTTDIIPFSNNSLTNRGIDDQSRLRFDELVYTGVIRTPLMSLNKKVPFNGEWQNIAAENFATTADVYRILSYIKDEDDLMETADGKEKDVPASIIRLSRMLGTDFVESMDTQPWYALAEYIAETQLQLLTNAVLRVLSGTSETNKTMKIVGAGTGNFLIRKLAERLNFSYVDFSELCNGDDEFQHDCNVCAPAVAVAQLNRQFN